MSVVAAIRPSDWELPLFVHVLGAIVLVGGLTTVVAALLLAWRREADEAGRLTRFALRSLLFGVLPGFVVMRIGAQWIYDEEFEGVGFGEGPEWAESGFVVTDPGSIVLVGAIAATWLAARRASRGQEFGRLVRVAAVLATLLLAVYVVVMWAMTAKPGS